MAAYEVSYIQKGANVLVREIHATWKEAKARLMELCKSGAYSSVAVRSHRRKRGEVK